MKKIFLFLFLSSSQIVFSQGHTGMKYIDSSKETASSKAVIVGEVPLAHTIQVMPFDKNGNLVGKDDAGKQVKQIFKNLSDVLEQADAKVADIVKVNAYINSASVMSAVKKAIGKKFATGKKPAITFAMGDLAHADVLVTLDVVAVSSLSAGEKVSYFKSKSLYPTTQTAQVAVLPPGRVVYVSGQADKGNLVEATRGTLKQLENTLEHLGVSKDQVIQIKAFTQPINDNSIVEKEIAQAFAGKTVPPIVYVEWTSKDPVIEIELIAASPKAATMPAQQLDFITPPFMTSSPVYCRVVRINFGKKVYISGLYGESANNGKSETGEIFSQLQDILKKAGSNFTNLVKATYYVTNTEASTALNQIRPKYYDPKRPPAASKASVKGVGPSKALTVDMIAVVP